MSALATDTPSKDGADRLGQVVSGRYRIQQLLGEGGMGAVYLAEHTLMRKRVALKLLHAEMSANAEVLARFEREAMAAAHIEHPNVAAATDFGRTEDGAFFLVLEYIEGTSLREVIGSGAMLPARAVHVARQIAMALERAHDAGIVHRDLKPENVMLVRKGDDPDFVKVLDFGIAKLSAETISQRGGADQPLTRMGTILGTPEYMAPEQALGEAVSAQSDLYAVGVILYEMLTGLHPFDPPDRMAMLSFHIVAPVPAMRDRAPLVDVPAPVEAVVRKLLEKDAKARYASARALVEALDVAASQSGLSAQTPRPRESLARIAPPSAARMAAAEPARDSSWHADDSFAKTSHGELVAPPRPRPNASMVASAATAAGLPAQRIEPSAGMAGVPGVPAIPMQASPLLQALDLLKKQPRGVLIAVASALPIGAILVVVVMVLALRGPKTKDDKPGEVATTKEAAKAAEPVKLASEERLKKAYIEGPEALEALAKEFPSDMRPLEKAALGYHTQGREADALRVTSSLMLLDAKAGSADLADIVGEIAARSRGENAETAYALLEGPFGDHGVDALAELATSKTSSRETRARAARSLTKPEVRAHASPATMILIDFKSATSCSAKKELLDRVREEGDARMIGVLKPLKVSRGCGFLGRGDCWPCLHRDGTLADTIAAIEGRAASK